MSRFQRMRRFTGILAWLAGTLAWQGLAVTGEPASAAATAWPGVDCHISTQPSGIRVAVCDDGSTSRTACGLIPLSAAPVSYPRRLRAPHGERWAAIDCPGPYPFGGVALMPESHRSAPLRHRRLG